jgi:hypothetical protein
MRYEFDPEATQICDSCGEEKYLGAFTRSKDSHLPTCRACRAALALPPIKVTSPNGAEGVIKAVEEDKHGNVTRVKIVFSANMHCWVDVVGPLKLPFQVGTTEDAPADR